MPGSGALLHNACEHWGGEQNSSLAKPPGNLPRMVCWVLASGALTVRRRAALGATDGSATGVVAGTALVAVVWEHAVVARLASRARTGL